MLTDTLQLSQGFGVSNMNLLALVSRDAIVENRVRTLQGSGSTRRFVQRFSTYQACMSSLLYLPPYLGQAYIQSELLLDRYLNF
jgi:hypothetical protein